MARKNIRNEADQSSWRKKIQASKVKFDDAAKDIFLKFYAETGRQYQAAQAAGVSRKTVYHHLQDDPEFEEAYEDAKQAYKDKILAHAHNLFYNGVDEPMLGRVGKDEDGIITHKKVYPVQLLAMEMRRLEAGYRDRSEVDLNVKGGVLIARPGSSPEEWEEEFGKPAPAVPESSAGAQ